MPVEVSARFVEAMREWRPDLVADESLWRLFVYLALGFHLHRRSHQVQLPYPLLAAFSDSLTKRVLDRQTFDGATQLLRRMQETLGRTEEGRWRFMWSKYKAGDHPRTIEWLELPSHVQAVVDAERRHFRRDGVVHVLDRTERGELRRITRVVRAKREKALIALAGQARPEAAYVPSLDVLDHLNALPSNQLSSRVHEHFSTACEAADREHQRRLQEAQQAFCGSLRADALARADEWYETSMRRLQALKNTAKPWYMMRSNSARLFPMYGGLPAIPSRLRRVLLPDLVEVDLMQLYFSIMPLLMRVPLTESFLKAGGVIWDKLKKDLRLGGMEDDPLRARSQAAVKEILKREGVYPAITGRRRGYIIRRIDEAMRSNPLMKRFAQLNPIQVARVGPDFVHHPMIVELLSARDVFLQEVKRCRYAIDHHGRRIGLASCSDPCDFRLDARGNERTLLSYLASQIEMDLMHALLELERAQKGRRFQILLWQHDGCSVALKETQRYDAASTVRAMQDAVARRAEELGVFTRLTVAYAPPDLCLARDKDLTAMKMAA